MVKKQLLIIHVGKDKINPEKILKKLLEILIKKYHLILYLSLHLLLKTI